MKMVEHKWSALPSPYTLEVLDRIPTQRVFDPDVDAIEAKLLWPRVWQMARPLED
jgi:hypothetical protein